jgi:hypothetical protein
MRSCLSYDSQTRPNNASHSAAVRSRLPSSGEVLKASGLLGCSEAAPDLSEHYKEEVRRQVAAKQDLWERCQSLFKGFRRGEAKTSAVVRERLRDCRLYDLTGLVLRERGPQIDPSTVYG